MENNLNFQFWYEILTLIPQITAGIIAFWLAFVIFRVGRVNELIDMIKDDLAGEDKNFYKNATREKWTRERELVNWLRHRIQSTDRRRKIVYDVLVERIDIKEKIYKYLNRNLLLSGITIIYCLILLLVGIQTLTLHASTDWAVRFALGLGIFSVSYALWSVSDISRL